MTCFAVIDTNVVVSSMLVRLSIPDRIISYVINGTVIPLLNQEILAEYKEVLERKDFGFDPADIASLINTFQNKAIRLERIATDMPFIDPDDAVFYEVVMAARNAGIEAFLITGNTRHFPAEPFVITPREALERIEKS